MKLNKKIMDGLRPSPYYLRPAAGAVLPRMGLDMLMDYPVQGVATFQTIALLRSWSFVVVNHGRVAPIPILSTAYGRSGIAHNGAAVLVVVHPGRAVPIPMLFTACGWSRIAPDGVGFANGLSCTGRYPGLNYFAPLELWVELICYKRAVGPGIFLGWAQPVPDDNNNY